jgi:hypothetical protein
MTTFYICVVIKTKLKELFKTVMEQSLNYSSMMRIIFSFLCYCPFRLFFTKTKDAAEVKLILYRKISFILALYNTLQKPAGVSQDKFSAGFQ